ncbi:protein ACCELERATED CELL DEATH 6-like [Syzygium oleosum]|uniref:protein ACCELERATED CELL DEATH 6-like n=1 Tax=Syzygium oleosum TaxID=219896 RepID=UPI0011D21B0C|nr:protein ACCELERATED CELL DEATH 6-like [Syzygium oleosum]
MHRDRVSITIKDDEIWEQRRARLKALESVHEPHTQVEFNYRVYPLLHAATKEGNIDKFIEALEKYSAEERVSLSEIIHIQGPSRNSLLHVAAGIENSDILQVLLEVIQDKQLAAQANDRGDTPLHVAARAGSIRMAELLLDCGSFLDKANEAGNKALHEAVKNGDYVLTDLLLRRQGSTSVIEKNEENKCPLYLAVEMGDLKILLRLLQAVDGNEVPLSGIEGMSPVLGAVMHQKLDMLIEMSEQKKELFDLRDAEGGTPLHLAAHENYVNGVNFLVNKFPWSAFERDEEGYLPIHVACKMGHLETIKELLRRWADPEELLTLMELQNILHVAAKYGRASVVKWIIGNPELEKLINAKDKEGNTPLHVATLQWQPKVLLSLTRDDKVDLKLVNNGNLTALDIVDEQLKEIDAPLRKSFTRTILVSAGTPRSKDKAICQPKGLGPATEPQIVDRIMDEAKTRMVMEKVKDEANTRMIVATLIAAMTFAAGFSVPGGDNGSEPDAEIARLLNRPMYDIFVICNSVAMYSSIIAVVILLWTQINDPGAMLHALGKTRLPLLIALATMSLAFMAGVYLTVSKHTWIAVVALIIGITALFIILGLYIALFIPLGYNCRLVQLFADFIIRAGISISMTEGWADNNSGQREYHLKHSGIVPRMDIIKRNDVIKTGDSEQLSLAESED